jgi:hypothetical protein
MKRTRWFGIPAAGVVAAAGVLSAGAVPLVAAAAPAVTSGGVALHVHGSKSGNWSGYADTQQSSPYTFVQASWTEPSYTCDGKSPESSAVWVGIDGYFGSQTVEQGGTIVICNGKKQGKHMAWWEMYPTNAVQEVFPVKPGDFIFASVTYKAGSQKPYNIFVWDETSDVSLNVNEACGSVPCIRSSAEWIVESPSFGGTTAYLPKFAPLVFGSGLASEQANGASPSSIASFPHAAITMTGSHGNRAKPSALTASGEGFTDKWISSS